MLRKVLSEPVLIAWRKLRKGNRYSPGLTVRNLKICPKLPAAAAVRYGEAAETRRKCVGTAEIRAERQLSQKPGERVRSRGPAPGDSAAFLCQHFGLRLREKDIPRCGKMCHIRRLIPVREMPDRDPRYIEIVIYAEAAPGEHERRIRAYEP